MMQIAKYLTLEQIMKTLNLKDMRSAKKWLIKNNIPIIQIGNRNVANEFIFQMKQQQSIVEQLMITYPNNWFEIYEANNSNKGMVKAMSIIYPQHRKVKRIANQKNKFIK